MSGIDSIWPGKRLTNVAGNGIIGVVTNEQMSGNVAMVQHMSDVEIAWLCVN